jgi:O-antigen ligase
MSALVSPTAVHPATAGGSAVAPMGETLRFAVLLALHVPLGLVVRESATLAALHALLVLAFGIWSALFGSTRRAIYAAAYIAGAEVLWRMADAPIWWEFGKYAVCLVLLSLLLRLGGAARWRLLPLAYFLALVPSIGLILADASLAEGELSQMVSFNLSGPLSLCLSVWVLGHFRLSRRDTRGLFAVLLAPTVALAAITLFSTYAAPNVTFGSESNLATSGGYGPNQVSVVLGLGSMVALLIALDTGGPLAMRVAASGAAVLCGVQSAMTFSRGGLYNAVLAAAAAAIFLARERRSRRALVVLVSGIGILTTTVVLPRLDSITGGALAERFRDTEPTQRQDIIAEDVRIWSEHPVAGVGPGGAKEQRSTESRIAHTEYSRLLAEHGTFGLLAIVALVAMVPAHLRRQRRPHAKARTASLALWGALAMFHVGMRLAAVGFTFGLAAIRFTDDGDEDD